MLMLKFHTYKNIYIFFFLFFNYFLNIYKARITKFSFSHIFFVCFSGLFFCIQIHEYDELQKRLSTTFLIPSSNNTPVFPSVVIVTVNVQHKNSGTRNNISRFSRGDPSPREKKINLLP